MFDSEDHDVLIVGAGPVGLLAGLALTEKGLDVQIVDTGVWATTHSYALTLHPQSIELFRRFGLADAVLDRSYPVETMGLYDRDGQIATLRLDGGHSAGPLAVLRQDALEGLLEEALRQRGVKVLWRHELTRLEQTEGQVTAVINKLERESRGYIVAHSEWVVAKSREVRVPFVVGADGHSSRVRAAADIEFPEVGPAQYYAVFEFDATGDLNGEMRLALGERTTDVLWPLPGGRFRWSFQLPDYHDKMAEQVKDSLLAGGFGYFPTDRTKDRSVDLPEHFTGILSDDNLPRLIAERAPWFKESIRAVTWRTLVRFEKRLATRFGQGRIWLAGDSAHLTGPAGIQSMNSGLMEAYDLAACLHRILKDRASHSLLADYNKVWTSQWRKLLGLEGGLEPLDKANPLVASRASDLITCLPTYGPELINLAGQLSLSVR